MWMKWEKLRIKRTGWYWVFENGSKCPQLVFAEKAEQDWKLHTYDGGTHPVSKKMMFCGPIDMPSPPTFKILSQQSGFTAVHPTEENKTACFQKVEFFNVDL
jgi:hypothetical protein